MTALFLSLILLLGTIFRFYHNTAVALWHDEAFSALYLRYPWTEMMYRIGLDVHPPLYYWVLRIWSYAAGQSVLSLRALSILFGVLTIWMGYLFVKAAFADRKLALLAAFFLAINPFQAQYALEARMYTLGTFLILLSSYLLVRALREKKFWIWYGLAAAAAIYTHYYLFFSVAAQGLYTLVYFFRTREAKTFARAIGAYFLAFALYLPWLPTFLAQVRRVEQNYWIPPIDQWSIPGTIWKMIFGGQGIRHSVLVIATLAALALIGYYLRRERNFAKWLVLSSIAVPFIAALAVSLRTNLYLDRYFVFASLFFAILATAALYRVPHPAWRAGALTVLAVMSVFAFFKNWTDLAIQNKPGMAAAAGYVNQNARGGNDIYVGSSFIFFTFEYYNHTPIKPLLYSTETLDKIPHFSGTALLKSDDLLLDFHQAAKGATVWLLWTTGFGGSKPAVPATWKQISEQGWEDAPGFKGTIYVTKYLAD